jgi:hypothetical protein
LAPQSQVVDEVQAGDNLAFTQVCDLEFLHFDLSPCRRHTEELPAVRALAWIVPHTWDDGSHADGDGAPLGLIVPG